MPTLVVYALKIPTILFTFVNGNPKPVEMPPVEGEMPPVEDFETADVAAGAEEEIGRAERE